MDKAIAFSRRQCLCALISSAIVVVCVCIGVTMNLTTLYDQDFDNMGIRTFCMFTVNSNILAALGMVQVLPFAAEGLRKNNYHLPNWSVVFLHAGTTAVALTFLVSLLVLSPVKGFVPIFTGSRFFLHGVCPILTIVSFGCFVSDHKVTRKESFWSLLPVFLYAGLYFVMVIVIGEENGGWEDFYGFATQMSPWISAAAILPVTYAIAAALRLWHNRLYANRKRREAILYKNEFENADIRALITAAGRSRAATQKVWDIVVPVRVIEIMVRDSDCSVDEGCRIFLNAYLDEQEKAGQNALPPLKK